VNTHPSGQRQSPAIKNYNDEMIIRKTNEKISWKSDLAGDILFCSGMISIPEIKYTALKT
jgi:hypothetical protein